MDPLTAFGLAANVGQMADLSAKVFTGLYKYSVTVKNAPKLSAEFRQEILVISDVLEELEVALKARPLDAQHGARLKEALAQFGEAINKIGARIQVEKGNFRKRFMWPFTQNEHEEYLSKFERFKSTFMLMLSGEERYTLLSISLTLESL